jgi:hypothetical protein
MSRQPIPQKQKRSDGVISYVVGATGSGKTTWVRQQLHGAQRVLVWDGKAEWGAQWGFKVVTNPRDLMQYVVPGAMPARVSYRVPVTRENFDTFCKLAWIACRSHVCALVVEELADVTTPSKAPTSWGEIVRKSRGFGTHVYALTQRPQEVDKTVQGNALIYHCGRVSDSMDATYVARRLLNVDPKQVIALAPLEFIERDVRTGAIRTGKVNPKSRK